MPAALGHDLVLQHDAGKPGPRITLDGAFDVDRVAEAVGAVERDGPVLEAGLTRVPDAIAVLVEYGGSGGRPAGPIANQLIRVLQGRGYLPPPSS